MNWEIGIDVYALLCVKQIASGNLLYSAGSSAQRSVMTWMGGMGMGKGNPGGRTYVYIELIHFIVQQKLTTL